MNFIEMLKARWQKADSMVCVGLDSDYSQIPESIRSSTAPVVRNKALEGFNRVTVRNFNREIVQATYEFVCAYKPNIAFYEEWGREGIKALEGTIYFIRQQASDIPIILDAKRTDIGNTNKGYAKMAFDVLGADAITVNPYFGGEALRPFLDRADKGVIVLCRTSNPGAKEFQDLPISLSKLPEEARDFFKNLWPGEESRLVAVYLYEYVAYRAVKEWNKNGNVLLVVGATYPYELARVRKIVGNMPILVPGIGAQAGDLEETVKAGMARTGFGMIINSARGIIFVSKGDDFAEAAGREAKKLRDQINKIKREI